MIVREIGDRRGEGTALWNTAFSLKKLGNHAEAIARAAEALPILDATESPSAVKARVALAKWRGGACGVGGWCRSGVEEEWIRKDGARAAESGWHARPARWSGRPAETNFPAASPRSW